MLIVKPDYYNEFKCIAENCPDTCCAGWQIVIDEESMKKQLEIAGCLDRTELEYHKALLNGELPYTIGGGIGQSRLCMLLLERAHIGEIQSSIWPEDMREKCAEKGIKLL